MACVLSRESASVFPADLAHRPAPEAPESTEAPEAPEARSLRRFSAGSPGSFKYFDGFWGLKSENGIGCFPLHLGGDFDPGKIMRPVPPPGLKDFNPGSDSVGGKRVHRLVGANQQACVGGVPFWRLVQREAKMETKWESKRESTVFGLSYLDAWNFFQNRGISQKCI